MRSVSVIRKPVQGNVAGNVLLYGSAGLAIDASRIELIGIQDHWERYKPSEKIGFRGGGGESDRSAYNTRGRFPANMIHDGSPQVTGPFHGDSGSAARFFYAVKGVRQ